jgi:hypothetical protein
MKYRVVGSNTDTKVLMLSCDHCFHTMPNSVSEQTFQRERERERGQAESRRRTLESPHMEGECGFDSVRFNQRLELNVLQPMKPVVNLQDGKRAIAHLEWRRSRKFT